MPALFATWLAILLAAAPARAASPDLSRVADEVSRGFLGVMGGCPARVWPGYHWRDLDVLLLQKGAAEQTLVSVSSGSVRKVRRAGIPEEAFDSSFQFFSYHGRATMALSLDSAAGSAGENDLVTQTFELGVHEAFHRLGQRGWKEKGGARGTEIPVRYEPRLYRASLYGRLRSALEGSDEAGNAARAAYWLGLWEKAFPSEVASATDGYEGTARYVEDIAELLRRNGCGASEEALRREAVRLADENFRATFDGSIFSLDGEGYDLGAMAGFVLRFVKGDAAWFARMRDGTTPVEALLAGAVAEPDAADERLQATFVAQAAREQSRAMAQVGPELALYGAEGSVFVGLSGDWHDGSEGLLDTWIDRARGVGFTSFSEGELMKAPRGHRGSLRAQAGAVFVEPEDNPCDAGRVLVFAPADVTLEGAELSVHSKGYQGRLPVVEKPRGARGERWLCVP